MSGENNIGSNPNGINNVDTEFDIDFDLGDEDLGSTISIVTENNTSGVNTAITDGETHTGDTLQGSDILTEEFDLENDDFMKDLTSGAASKRWLSRVNDTFKNVHSVIFGISGKSRHALSQKLQKSLNHGIELYNMDDQDAAADDNEDGDSEGLNDLQNMLYFNKHLRKRRALKGMAVKATGVALVLILFLYLFTNGLWLLGQDDFDPKRQKTKVTDNGVLQKFDPHRLYSNGTHDLYPITLLLNLGGVSPVFLNDIDTPMLDILYRGVYNESSTVSAPYMIPGSSFQSIPNLWSLVTGLNPMSHRLLNDEYDIILSELKDISSSTPTATISDKKKDKEQKYAFYEFDGFDDDIGSSSKKKHNYLEQIYRGNLSIWSQIQKAYFNDLNSEMEFKVDAVNWPGSLVDHYAFDANFSKPFFVNEDQDYLNFDETGFGKKNTNKNKNKNKEFDIDYNIEKVFQHIDNFDTHSDIPGLILQDIPVMERQGFVDDMYYYTENLQKVDEYLFRIFENIQERNMSSMFNVMITSDHGTVSLLKEKVHVWEDYISKDTSTGKEINDLISESFKKNSNKNMEKILKTINEKIDSGKTKSGFSLTTESDEVLYPVDMFVFHSPYIGFSVSNTLTEALLNKDGSSNNNNNNNDNKNNQKQTDGKNKNFYRLYSLLKDSFQDSKHFQVYENHGLPAHLKYLDSLQNGMKTIWIVPEPGYFLVPPVDSEKVLDKSEINGDLFEDYDFERGMTDDQVLFVNGYDVDLISSADNIELSSLFLGVGPYFDKFDGYNLKPFANVEVYQILSDMIGLKSYNNENDCVFEYPLSLKKQKEIWYVGEDEAEEFQKSANFKGEVLDFLEQKFGLENENSFMKKWLGKAYDSWRASNYDAPLTSTLAPDVSSTSIAETHIQSTSTQSTSTLSTSTLSTSTHSTSTASSSSKTLSESSLFGTLKTSFTKTSSTKTSSILAVSSTSKSFNDYVDKIISEIESEANELMDQVNDFLEDHGISHP